MLDDMTKEQITHVQGLFEAKKNAEETHSLTMTGYTESFNEFAKTLKVKPEVINKATNNAAAEYTPIILVFVIYFNPNLFLNRHSGSRRLGFRARVVGGARARRRRSFSHF